MIKDFQCKHTQALFEGKACYKRFRPFREQAERKLQMLNSAQTVMDLRSPPGNHLETLGGNLDGKWSIRINKKFRLIFVWDETENHARGVYIGDYH
jgi:proteic killer suppression protein